VQSRIADPARHFNNKPDMIIVRLFAGLGNQMFQYAAGLALAESRRTVLKLDVSWFREYADMGPHNRYALSCFNVTEQFATQEEVERLRGRELSRAGRGVRKAARLLQVDHLFNVYRDEGRWHRVDWKQFDQRVASLPDDTYLDGLCHSERYFTPIGELVRRHFSLRYPVHPSVAAMAEKIQSGPSIAVHFRRGDYVSNAAAARDIGALDAAYYQQAFREMRERFPAAVFYVFSDDIEAVAREITPPGPHTFVRGMSGWQDFEALRLMSLCDHVILSNSTFSWWAAWLNPSPDKFIIAPQPWCRDPERSTGHMVPESWHLVSRAGDGPGGDDPHRGRDRL